MKTGVDGYDTRSAKGEDRWKRCAHNIGRYRHRRVQLRDDLVWPYDERLKAGRGRRDEIG